MTELGWDEGGATMVKDDSDELPTIRPPRPDATPAPVPKPLDLERIGVLPAKRYVSQLAITEVSGDERQTWSFLKVTMPLPMVKAMKETQALPLVRVRRRRLLNGIPWAATISGALSGVALCWWLTLPKAPPVTTELRPARAAIAATVSGFEVSAPAGTRVVINGEERAVIPESGQLRVEGLFPGEHRLRFDGRPHRGVLERHVTLRGGQVSELDPVSL